MSHFAFRICNGRKPGAELARRVETPKMVVAWKGDSADSDRTKPPVVW